MTTATTTKTQTYRITIPFTSWTTIEVERPEDISELELLKSITREELANGEDDGDSWSSLKDSWRESQPGDFHITDDECEPLFQD